MEMALDEKKAKRDEAETVLKEKEVALQKAGEIKKAKAGSLSLLESVIVCVCMCVALVVIIVSVLACGM